MCNILITGATGNIGIEVIRFLYETNTSHHIVAGVRNIEKAKIHFKAYPGLSYVHFDFEDASSFEAALEGIDRVFLLRPPHLSDVDHYFKPLISALKTKNIKEIVFLSVQGAEKSKVIPHNKIERLIRNSEMGYIYLRPSYFMQNLTTTLLPSIIAKREILLPAGKARFNWIDVKNIGEIAAILLNRFDAYKNREIELTGMENETFGNVTKLINECIKNTIEYRSVSPYRFYKIKKREGMVGGMIMVMIMLHFLPRFQKDPVISEWYQELTGKKPTDLKSFVQREKQKFA